MGEFFATTTILIARQRAVENPACYAWDGECEEAMSKLHDFFHRQLHAPITWLVAENMLERYAATFRAWCEAYGDEIGIYERGLTGSAVLGGWRQDWVEQIGITPPRVGIPWMQVPEDVQVTMLAYLKARFDSALQQDTKLLYAANGNAASVRAMKKVGLQLLWGYNWNLNGDGVDTTGKGCLPFPFYVSDVHAKAAAPAGDTSVMGMHWGAMNLVNAYCSSRMAKISLNDTCLNAHELANKTPAALVDHDGEDSRAGYAERLIAEYAAQARWNPYSLVPFQLEAEWIDESGFAHGQHPPVNTRNTEMLFHLAETAVRHGAKMITCEQFLDWHRARFDRTPEMLWYSEDILQGVRIRGKDHDYAPMLLYGNHERQTLYLMAQGFNPVRSYTYTPAAEVEDSGLEYPFTREPNVELQVKDWTSPRFGIVLDTDGARYEAQDHHLTAWDTDEPDYSFVLWKANVPAYVNPEDLALSPNITGIKLLREKNLALVFASLVRGHNRIAITSTKPNAFIRIEEQRVSGRRFEIYIRNDGPEVALCSLRAKIGPNRQVGGFWWDGHYQNSIYHYNYNNYDWRTDGDIVLNTVYPFSLPLRQGLTRCSIELLGNVRD